MHRLRRQGGQPALNGFGTPRHLAKRFLGSLWPAGPGPAGEAWARNWLAPAEVGVWEGMSGPDRRHAVGVARRVAEAAGNADGAGVQRSLLAAALLHDTGKQRSGLGVFARSAVTVVAMAAGRQRVASWSTRGSGLAARAGDYVRHDEIGAAMLEAAGSDPLVVAWAREHHLPAPAWTVDPAHGRMLKDADDD